MKCDMKRDMKQNNFGTVAIVDFFAAVIWALCAIFNIAAEKYLWGAVSLVLFTVFMAMGFANRQRR